MVLSLLMALQAAAAPAAAPAPPLPVDFDLAELARRQAEGRCGAASTGNEIVVCGRRPGAGDYPMEKWERVFRERPLVAEKDIGGGAVARAYVEQVELGSGQVSKRVMVGVNLKF